MSDITAIENTPTVRPSGIAQSIPVEIDPETGKPLVKTAIPTEEPVGVIVSQINPNQQTVVSDEEEQIE